MPACLTGRNDRESRFHHRGGSLKLVQASLGVKKVRESTFHHCEGPVKLVQGCLSGKKDRTKQFSSLWRSSETHAGLFMCQE